LPNQLIFAETANFCLLTTQLSFAESSSGILMTQQVFADTAYFCWPVNFLPMQHMTQP